VQSQPKVTSLRMGIGSANKDLDRLQYRIGVLIHMRGTGACMLEQCRIERKNRGAGASA